MNSKKLGGRGGVGVGWGIEGGGVYKIWESQMLVYINQPSNYIDLFTLQVSLFDIVHRTFKIRLVG